LASTSAKTRATLLLTRDRSYASRHVAATNFRHAIEKDFIVPSGAQNRQGQRPGFEERFEPGLRHAQEGRPTSLGLRSIRARFGLGRAPALPIAAKMK